MPQDTSQRFQSWSKHLSCSKNPLQCFDAVGWVAGRASGL